MSVVARRVEGKDIEIASATLEIRPQPSVYVSRESWATAG